jgi:hypothetical protein
MMRASRPHDHNKGMAKRIGNVFLLLPPLPKSFADGPQVSLFNSCFDVRMQ